MQDNISKSRRTKKLKYPKIVSGGQTGVDRAALDAALSAGIECGGWCPKGRKAEDGSISDNYPLTEMDKEGYRPRTIRNVQDSDATLIFYFGEVTGGTALTVSFCMKEKKPFKLIDGKEISKQRAAEMISEFVFKHQIKTLNVAGPRGSGDARAYPYTYDVLSIYLKVE